MARTPNLDMPEILHGEVNGDVTHNESLWIMDLHGQPIVEARQSAEPSSPVEGQAWIVIGTPTGSNWGSDAQANQVAHYYAGIWHYHTPSEGWRFYVKSESIIYIFDGLSWTSFGNPGLLLSGTANQIVAPHSSDKKVENYSIGAQWEWIDQSDVNKSAGELTVPLNGIYRCTGALMLQQTGTNKEEDLYLKWDIQGGSNPGVIYVDSILVASDKGDRWRQLSAVFTQEFESGQVLSLYVGASGNLNNFDVMTSTFEIRYITETGTLLP